MSEPQDMAWINTTAETFEKDVMDRSLALPVDSEITHQFRRKLSLLLY